MDSFSNAKEPKWKWIHSEPQAVLKYEFSSCSWCKNNHYVESLRTAKSEWHKLTWNETAICVQSLVNTFPSDVYSSNHEEQKMEGVMLHYNCCAWRTYITQITSTIKLAHEDRNLFITHVESLKVCRFNFIYLNNSIRACKKVLKLLCRLIEVSSSSAMFPNTCKRKQKQSGPNAAWCKLPWESLVPSMRTAQWA